MHGVRRSSLISMATHSPQGRQRARRVETGGHRASLGTLGTDRRNCVTPGGCLAKVKVHSNSCGTDPRLLEGTLRPELGGLYIW